MARNVFSETIFIGVLNSNFLHLCIKTIRYQELRFCGNVLTFERFAATSGASSCSETPLISRRERRLSQRCAKSPRQSPLSRPMVVPAVTAQLSVLFYRSLPIRPQC